MYEAESNILRESISQLPEAAISSFAELSGRVISRSLLPWSEHCTECVWPTCYSTCDLYEPRKDLRCRRFVDGMVRIDCPGSLNSYLLKIRFKRWGKLWTPGNTRMLAMDIAHRIDRRDQRIGQVLYNIPLPTPVKRTLTTKRYSFKKRMAKQVAPHGNTPTSFMVECFNPQDYKVSLSVVMRSLDPKARIAFEHLAQFPPGFSRIRIPVQDITKLIDLETPFNIELIPNDFQDGMTLYFGFTDFVQETAVSVPATQMKVKCVVWDLDNTLWQGILVEDGPAKLQLKADLVEMIRELDRRGILNSIASKNNHDEVMGVLKQLKMDEYFLCPQISWGPKSEAVKAIAQTLNVGLDTLLFIDDSDFELQQVKSACPQVRTLNASDAKRLVDMEECNVPATEEAVNRRKMYQVDASRQEMAKSFGEDYLGFLRQSNIHLNIHPLSEANLERVHELTQRTNQMNFSGNRYDKEVLRTILSSPYLDTYVLDCEDRFGKYGIIGFSLVDSREPRMTDLMFSCRVQSKRVEHGFISFLVRKYLDRTGKQLIANYRKTERNEPSGRVFEDLAMKKISEKDGVSFLAFPEGEVPADEQIITIISPEDGSTLEKRESEQSPVQSS